MALGLAPFPEEFLRTAVPDYEWSHTLVTTLLVVSLVFWVLIFPVLVSSTPESSASPPLPSAAASLASNHQKKDTRPRNDATTAGTTTGNHNNSNKPSEVIREAPAWASVVTVLGLMVTSVLILAVVSPYNWWLSRRVLVAPLLTRAECDDILARSEAAAQRNAQHAQAKHAIMASSKGEEPPPPLDNQTKLLLDDPAGWQKQRHGSYPTTDLNWVTDAFTADDRAYLKHLLDRRLAPVLSRLLGVPPRSIRTNDLFVVRYDAAYRAHLANHSDDGDVSFNILLNDDFRGGGTRFWKRRPGTDDHPPVGDYAFGQVQPTEPGTVLLHSALVQHEGLRIAAGTRYILVGFTAIDRVHPLSEQQTGLSWLASWAHWNWMTVKAKGSVHNTARRLMDRGGGGRQEVVHQWDEHVYVRSLFADLYKYMKASLDWLCPHTVEANLIAPHDKARFLQALDDLYNPAAPHASWFKGQLLRVNVDGTLESEWGMRAENPERFKEL